jgi:NAD(P)H-hydrate epimerase
MEKNRIQALADLLKQTGHAHHQAFIETDGADPEWALWYAQYLEKLLSEFLQKKLTRSRIVYELIRMEETVDPGEQPWTEAYARDWLERYG